MSLKNLFVQKPTEGTATKAEKRVATLQTHDLVPWAEQCLYAVGRCLSEWSRDTSRTEALLEAVEGSEALQVVMKELQRRAI